MGTHSQSPDLERICLRICDSQAAPRSFGRPGQQRLASWQLRFTIKVQFNKMR